MLRSLSCITRQGEGPQAIFRDSNTGGELTPGLQAQYHGETGATVQEPVPGDADCKTGGSITACKNRLHLTRDMVVHIETRDLHNDQ